MLGTKDDQKKCRRSLGTSLTSLLDTMSTTTTKSTDRLIAVELGLGGLNFGIKSALCGGRLKRSFGVKIQKGQVNLVVDSFENVRRQRKLQR